MTKSGPISNKADESKRLVLPPISSIDGFNRSWTGNPISPTSTASTVSPCLLQDTADLWTSNTTINSSGTSSLSYRKEQSRTDYFTDNSGKERSSSSAAGLFVRSSSGEQFRYERPMELILTPSSLASTSLFSIEKDVNQVIRQSRLLSENMNQKRNSILDQQYDDPWLDEMINQANDVLNALIRLRKHQLAADYVPERHEVQEEHGEVGGDVDIPQQDIKRKRGRRAAFQGRCHSCNISETPEWRRGPDGARTLCNACGLHYAKLARKKAGKDSKKGSLQDTAMK
ncbi:GATA-domain-containing protein [Backusella circina FSU 941]|nr:GATA-domain-containing protein [Backusella circina FSU 941]